MIICPNCKSQCTPNQKFCTVCGTQLLQISSQSQQQSSEPGMPQGTYYTGAQQAGYSYPQAAYQPPAPKKKSNVWLIVVIAVVAVICIVSTILLISYIRKIKGKSTDLLQTATAIHSVLETETHGQDFIRQTEEVTQSELNSAERTATAFAQEVIAAQTQAVLNQEALEAQRQATQTQEAYYAEQTAIAKVAEEQAVLALLPEDVRPLVENATKVDTPTYQEEVYVHDDWLEDVWVAGDIKNFVLTATFDNPIDVRVNDYWEMGILFRSKAANDQLRLFVKVPKYWELSYVGGSGGYWSTVRSWTATINALDLSEGGSNTITLVSKGHKGSFYINGVFISDLDLSSRANYGNISLWLEYNTIIRDKEKTIFRDIHLWDLD